MKFSPFVTSLFLATWFPGAAGYDDSYYNKDPYGHDPYGYEYFGASKGKGKGKKGKNKGRYDKYGYKDEYGYKDPSAYVPEKVYEPEYGYYEPDYGYERDYERPKYEKPEYGYYEPDYGYERDYERPKYDKPKRKGKRGGKGKGKGGFRKKYEDPYAPTKDKGTCPRARKDPICYKADLYGYGVEGFVLLEFPSARSTTMHLTAKFESLPDKIDGCSTDDMKIHLHSYWNTGYKSYSDSGYKSYDPSYYKDPNFGYGEDACKAEITGGHYDPLLACGDASNNVALCEILKRNVDYPIKFGYECGDWSGQLEEDDRVDDESPIEYETVCAPNLDGYCSADELMAWSSVVLQSTSEAAPEPAPEPYKTKYDADPVVKDEETTEFCFGKRLLCAKLEPVDCPYYKTYGY